MTKLEAVRRAIVVMEQERLLCSADKYGLTPLKNEEKRWTEIGEALHEIREIAKALQAETVRRSIAEWQMEIMAQQEKEPVKVNMKELDQPGGMPA